MKDPHKGTKTGSENGEMRSGKTKQNLSFSLQNSQFSPHVPRLRFPEFRNACEWKPRTLGSVCSSFSGGTPSTSQPEYYDGDIPFIRSAEIGRDKTELFLTRSGLSNSAAKIITKGDVLVALYGANSGDVALARIDGAINQAILCLKSKESNAFIYQFLSYKKDWVVATYLQGGQGNLSGDIVKSISVCFPPPKEQQKIADCLTSLDDLIAAQARKLDAFKTHKKGLMQQLFPREGETQPRLRFPEFRNAGEWKSDSLGNIFETTSGGTPSRSVKEYWDGEIPWITTSLVDFRVITDAEEFISEEGLKNSSAKLFPKGTVLIAMYGQGKTRGQVALLSVEAATNQACVAVLPRKEIDPYFVFLNLAGRYEELRQLSNSGGQENLSQGLIREISFSYPSNDVEQRTIISCLSALDDLIATQTEKLEALKTHKKGLMQQLFSSPEE